MIRQRAALERRDTLVAAMKNIILSITIGIDLGDKNDACILARVDTQLLYAIARTIGREFKVS